MISIVVPCYNEEESLPYFYKEIKKVMNEMKNVKFELVFVNDGSKDKTLEILKKMAKDDKSVKYVSFTRNFGKEAGMLAGLEYTTGDYVAIMDADLQDPPKLIKTMYEIINTEDYDCVGLRRVTRKGEPVIRSWFARNYYKLINKISKTKVVDGARDFRLMTRAMVDSILKLQENNRYSKGLFSWVGYNTKWLEYENVERVAGTTKWSFYKLLLYSIESIVAFSSFPLVFPIILGLMSLFASFVLLVIIIIKAIMSIKIASLLVISTLIVFALGMQLLFLGVLGLYISKIHFETKKRPIYLVKETNIKKAN